MMLWLFLIRGSISFSCVQSKQRRFIPCDLFQISTVVVQSLMVALKLTFKKWERCGFHIHQSNLQNARKLNDHPIFYSLICLIKSKTSVTYFPFGHLTMQFLVIHTKSQHTVANNKKLSYFLFWEHLILFSLYHQTN